MGKGSIFSAPFSFLSSLQLHFPYKTKGNSLQSLPGKRPALPEGAVPVSRPQPGKRQTGDTQKLVKQRYRSFCDWPEELAVH